MLHKHEKYKCSYFQSTVSNFISSILNGTNVSCFTAIAQLGIFRRRNVVEAAPNVNKILPSFFEKANKYERIEKNLLLEKFVSQGILDPLPCCTNVFKRYFKYFYHC